MPSRKVRPSPRRELRNELRLRRMLLRAIRKTEARIRALEARLAKP